MPGPQLKSIQVNLFEDMPPTGQGSSTSVEFFSSTLCDNFLICTIFAFETGFELMHLKGGVGLRDFQAS